MSRSAMGTMESRPPPVVNVGFEAISWLEDLMHMILLQSIYVDYYSASIMCQSHVFQQLASTAGQSLLHKRR